MKLKILKKNIAFGLILKLWILKGWKINQSNQINKLGAMERVNQENYVRNSSETNIC